MPIKNDKYVMTEAEHNRLCRRAELQLAISNAIALTRYSMQSGNFGHLDDLDEAVVLTQMASERALKL